MCLPLFYPCTQPVVMIVKQQGFGASARNHRLRAGRVLIMERQELLS